MSGPPSTFTTVFEEWKSQLVRWIEAGGDYLGTHPFSTIDAYHKRR
jgi:hypothetical protein